MVLSELCLSGKLEEGNYTSLHFHCCFCALRNNKRSNVITLPSDLVYHFYLPFQFSFLVFSEICFSTVITGYIVRLRSIVCFLVYSHGFPLAYCLYLDECTTSMQTFLEYSDMQQMLWTIRMWVSRLPKVVIRVQKPSIPLGRGNQSAEIRKDFQCSSAILMSIAGYFEEEHGGAKSMSAQSMMISFLRNSIYCSSECLIGKGTFQCSTYE